MGFDSAETGMQFVERVEWMPTFGIQYAVGVDGVSILLVLLTALLCPLCVLAFLERDHDSSSSVHDAHSCWSKAR